MGRITRNKTQKLLYRTFEGYAFFAVILLIISMPLAYSLMQKLHLDDINEALGLRKKEFLTYHLSSFQFSEIEQWNRFNRDIKIVDTLRNLHNDLLVLQSFYDKLDQELEPYLVLYSPVTIQQKPFVLLIRQNLIEEKDLILHIIWLYLGLLVFLLLGLLALTQFYSTRLWQPFYNTLHQIEHFELGISTFPKFDPVPTQEFKRLNTVLENLIQKSIAIYQSQKEFIENAAHELQTPLAVLHAKLDVFLQMPDLSPNQMQALDSLYDLLARLNRLNKNLFLLSKIDNQTFQQTETFRLKDLIERQLLFFEEQALQKNISLEVLLSEGKPLQANLTLTESCVSNLLFNAIRHNHENGKIRIKLQDNLLTISNTGQNSPLPTIKLFQRFAKIDSSTQGNGLGLAIVKKIADLYDWQVDYVFENDWHQFILRI